MLNLKKLSLYQVCVFNGNIAVLYPHFAFHWKTLTNYDLRYRIYYKKLNKTSYGQASFCCMNSVKSFPTNFSTDARNRQANTPTIRLDTQYHISVSLLILFKHRYEYNMTLMVWFILLSYNTSIINITKMGIWDY